MNDERPERRRFQFGLRKLLLGGVLVSIVYYPKWAFWGAVIGLVFSGLLVLSLFVRGWFLGDDVLHGPSWEARALVIVFVTLYIAFNFAGLVALLKMVLPGRTVNDKDERPTMTEDDESHGC